MLVKYKNVVIGKVICIGFIFDCSKVCVKVVLDKSVEGFVKVDM